jgi:hypothetical protein
MPSVSLVVCIYQQRELLRRLLSNARGYYDDLVVVHDGPDKQNVAELVREFDGRFFEHPKIGSLEGQSPFAWKQAAHDWILRLDADELPSDEMKKWLQAFRGEPDPPNETSGFTCYWPLWNGERAISNKWPGGRIFLFNRQRVRFFGLIEQVPIPDGKYLPLSIVLHHQPNRKSYGFKNVLFRKQAHQWREIIARSLLGRPTDLPCWRWESESWPASWELIRQHPIISTLSRLPVDIFRTLRDQWRRERRLFPVAAISGPLHHLLIGFELWRLQRKQSVRFGG